jgi:hypothetical protein
MKQQNAHPREHVVERWAHALGISGERLLTLVREVVEERQPDLLGAASGLGKDRPSRLAR